MTIDTPARCQRCRRSSVYWPRTLTVIGPIDLCGDCYWEYVDSLASLEAFFRPNFGAMTEGPTKHDAQGRRVR